MAMLEVGLCPIPCGGSGNKKPGINFRTWPAIPSSEVIATLAANPRFANHAVGILTGRGQFPVVVLDCDDEGQLPGLIEIFGATPLMVATPSGGRHLYYRHGGEGCRNLRRFGLAADIKGRNGFVVAPPSARDAAPGRPAGRYRIASGAWSDLGRLPPIRAEAWSELKTRQEFGRGDDAIRPSAAPAHGERYLAAGERNDTLFMAGLRLARTSSSEDDVRKALVDLNRSRCRPALDPAEVHRIANSCWRYQAEDRNWVGKGGTTFTRDEVDEIGDADAFWLLIQLEFRHAARDAPFALQFRRMAAEQSIAGMGEHRLRAAARRLEQAGYLARLHAGGDHPGDAAQYRLRRPRRTTRV